MTTALSDDAAALGLTRRVVRTGAGPVVVHAGTGDGPGVVLLHGAAGSWTTWTPLLRHAAEAGDPLPGVVALDLPGWGGSPSPGAPLTAASAAHAVAEVARACGHERWRVVGHSLGGFLALRLAALEPERTTGVVLVSPTGPAVGDAVRHPVRGGARLPWFAGMLVAMRALAALPGQGRGVLTALDRLGVLPRLAAPLFHDPGTIHPSVTAALASEIRPLAFVAAARASTLVDLGAFQAVRCRVRAVRGARDVFAGSRDAAALRRLLPDFAEEVLPDAGHFAAVERPDAVLAALAAVAG
ncbi:alpha/beta fold hydrolase [Amnibacterium endophyticum]|uniref:Alpha/beta fold hydrolase n=1 Tax=Amnibacterium endophyticum TaxID=2109337 RepID=A0ABW4LFF7_9MICO